MVGIFDQYRIVQVEPVGTGLFGDVGSDSLHGVLVYRKASLNGDEDARQGKKVQDVDEGEEEEVAEHIVYSNVLCLDRVHVCEDQDVVVVVDYLPSGGL